MDPGGVIRDTAAVIMHNRRPMENPVPVRVEVLAAGPVVGLRRPPMAAIKRVPAGQAVIRLDPAGRAVTNRVPAGQVVIKPDPAGRVATKRARGRLVGMTILLPSGVTRHHRPNRGMGTHRGPRAATEVISSPRRLLEATASPVTMAALTMAIHRHPAAIGKIAAIAAPVASIP